jgi:hypothetical protein
MILPKARLSKQEGGFTLVEVLISVSVLMITVMVFIPVILFAVNGAEKNRMRTVATSLANAIVEELRSMPFEDIGLISGNPEGEVEPERTETIDNRRYRVNIYINWEELDEQGENASWDYKLIRVDVTPLGPFVGEAKTVSVKTIIARDKAQPFLSGANIRTWVYRGWKEGGESSPDEPVGLVKVEVTKGLYSNSAVTTSKGKALFLDLEEGEYSVAVDPSVLFPPMILMPGTGPFIVDITEGQTTEVVARVELPCSLSLSFNDGEGNPVAISGTVILELPFVMVIDQDGGENGEEVVTEVITVEKDVFNASSVYFENLWPVGTGFCGAYNLRITGDINYNMAVADNKPRTTSGSEWDGKFEGPGTTMVLNLRL